MSVTQHKANLQIGRRVALASILASAGLAFANISIGFRAGSTSTFAAGLEFLGDVLASTFVLVGMLIAARPADPKHPYGYGRYETLAGLIVGLILTAGGAGICWRSLERISEVHAAPDAYAAWPLLGAIVVRGAMSAIKFRVGRGIHSASLEADAWNDSVDIVSACGALLALGLTLYDPVRFLAADHYGGCLVGLVVVFTGLKVIRDAASELADAMPDAESLGQIRRVALSVTGVLGVDKCFARKTGLQYHVDLHIEVDPNITIWESHELAGETRSRLRAELDWVADVLVHVEPAPGVERRKVAD